MAAELDALLVVRLGDAQKTSRAKVHLRPLLLDPVKQLLHIDPWSLEAKRRPLCAANDAHDSCLVTAFILGSVTDSGDEVRTVVVDVVSGLPLRGAVVHVARDSKHLGISWLLRGHPPCGKRLRPHTPGAWSHPCVALVEWKL